MIELSQKNRIIELIELGEYSRAKDVSEKILNNSKDKRMDKAAICYLISKPFYNLMNNSFDHQRKEKANRLAEEFGPFFGFKHWINEYETKGEL